MKKILLATALTAVSLTSVNAEPVASPAGKGWYIAGQVGGGFVHLSSDNQIFENKDDVFEASVKKNETFPFGGIQFIWGYSHRLENNMTVGFEAAVISPAFRLGHMINDSHHITAGVHYAFLLKTAVAEIKDMRLKKEFVLKDILKADFDVLSGFGLSIGYEYFFPSKNFFRTQLRADYYGGDLGFGKLSGAKAPLPFLFEGKGYAWDVTLYVGFGTQW